MQIALTKKLSTAMGINPPTISEEINPLFCWTANWTKVWDNRRTEDMLVLINNATRFTVAIYEVKKKSLKNVGEMMKSAISNTLLSMNLNSELVEEYMRLLGEVEFVKNSNRKASSWVSKSGIDCSFYVARKYNGMEKVFDDTIGALQNGFLVNYSGTDKCGFYPDQKMIDELSRTTGIKPYKCRAFELEVTLDLEIYKAMRKIRVPANIKFSQLHDILQTVFKWKNYHLYDFTVFNENKEEQIARIVPFEEDLEYDEVAILMEDHTLSEFLSDNRYIIYTYDMGDNWNHEIKLVNVIEEYDKELPYLVEVSGQIPPEDVGGVSGFISFREAMLDTNSPEYEGMREWCGYWNVELSDREKCPRVISGWI